MQILHQIGGQYREGSFILMSSARQHLHMKVPTPFYKLIYASAFQCLIFYLFVNSISFDESSNFAMKRSSWRIRQDSESGLPDMGPVPDALRLAYSGLLDPVYPWITKL